MNHRERFEIWKRRRERIEVSIGFPERVMAHIQERPASASASRLRRMIARPWAKAAVVVLGVLLGLVRIVLTLDLILRA